MSWLYEALMRGTDPIPMIPDAPEPPYSKPAEFPNGRPWVLSEDEHARWAAAGYPEVWEARNVHG